MTRTLPTAPVPARMLTPAARAALAAQLATAPAPPLLTAVAADLDLLATQLPAVLAHLQAGDAAEAATVLAGLLGPLLALGTNAQGLQAAALTAQAALDDLGPLTTLPLDDPAALTTLAAPLAAAGDALAELALRVAQRAALLAQLGLPS